jgi:hypothetical protein
LIEDGAQLLQTVHRQTICFIDNYKGSRIRDSLEPGLVLVERVVVCWLNTPGKDSCWIVTLGCDRLLARYTSAICDASVFGRCSSPTRPNLSVEDKTSAYSLTTPSGEEHQFAGIVDVARWTAANALG